MINHSTEEFYFTHCQIFQLQHIPTHFSQVLSFHLVINILDKKLVIAIWFCHRAGRGQSHKQCTCIQNHSSNQKVSNKIHRELHGHSVSHPTRSIQEFMQLTKFSFIRHLTTLKHIHALKKLWKPKKTLRLITLLKTG